MNSSSAELQRISNAIHVVRGVRIIPDRDLAVLYGVSTMRLNEAVSSVRQLIQVPDSKRRGIGFTADLD